MMTDAVWFSDDDCAFFECIRQEFEELFSKCMTAAISERPSDRVAFLIDFLTRKRRATAAVAEALPQHEASGHNDAAEPATSVADGDEQLGQANTWTAEAWLASLGVARIVATSLLPPQGGTGGGHGRTDDQLAAARALHASAPSAAALADRLRDERLIESLTSALHPALRDLSAPHALASGEELHGKFLQDVREGRGFTLQYADLSSFFGGLEAKIGAPDPRVRLAMAREHTRAADSLDEFTTGNYEVTTTPTLEWLFCAAPSSRAGWPVEQRLLRRGPREHMRTPMPLAEMAARLAAINERLAALGEPAVLAEEQLGGRLYTGPMFVKYNDLLRGFGGALAGCKGNAYVTTTHAINSIVVKTSKLTAATKVYRGIAGGVLPRAFWEANAHGVRGGVEGAFMSTTFDRAVAMHYAAQPGQPSVVFEMQMGMVDRGAELGWLSQYPHESECLFAPLTGVEVQRTRCEGATLVVEARLSINLTALTLEQVVSKRHRLVRELAASMRSELDYEWRSEAAAAAGGEAPAEAGEVGDEAGGEAGGEAGSDERRAVWAAPRAVWRKLAPEVADLRALGQRVLASELAAVTERPAGVFNDDAELNRAVNAVVEAKHALLLAMAAAVRPTPVAHLLDAIGAGTRLADLLGASTLAPSEPRHRLGAEGAGAIALIACALPGVTHLNLYKHACGDVGVRALVCAFTHGAMPSLARLNLNRNAIGPDGARALAAVIRTGRLPTLEKLHLSFNRIGDEGVAAIADAGGALRQLHLLHLDSNEAVGDAGGLALARSLATPAAFATLSVLQVSTGNNLTNASKRALLTALHGRGVDDDHHDVELDEHGAPIDVAA